MQAVLLAAGMGKRLRNYTEDNTKCMVKVNGKRIVDSLFESLLMVNTGETKIERVIVVTGYEGAKLRTYLSEKYKNASFAIEYVDNGDYAVTNNIYSLWLARNYLMQDDTILLESDILFDKHLIKDLVQDNRMDLVVVDKFLHFMDGTMILLDNDDNITSFIPKSEFRYDQAGEYYKTVNIYKFSVEFLNKYYLPFLDAYIKAFGQNEYYELVLRVLSFLPGTGLKGFKMNGRKWYEIDNAQALDIASQIFSSDESRSVNLAGRYGGYWRFGEILDYCYLVNPYFPEPAYLEEMKYMFENLLRNYPSGITVQNLLSSEMFECSKDYILTGNGAAELIKALAEILDGRVGMVFPSFNEYAERIKGEIVPFFPADQENFSYSADEIILWAEKVDSFVIINPDNPSGTFLGKDNLLKVIKYFNDQKKRIIIDESFLDFALQNDTNGLLSDKILTAYPYLVVVKSISKSYGVPGVRLGVLATSDTELLGRIRKGLAIWNINSFGEFFMQMYPKHRKQYLDSCMKIAGERDWFFSELSKFDFIRVIPSKANYFLCEINRYTAPELQTLLLDGYNIFIKDLTGKIGVPKDREFIRIAVRDRRDNEIFLTALSDISEGRS